MGARIRCNWASSHSDYFEYHDQDWGVPEEHDQMVFEKLCLELFQSGLSWRTILNKRENFRKAFNDFDVYHVSRFPESQIAKLLDDKGIVRHRGKIEAVVHNGIRAKELIEDFGSLNHYFWSFEGLESNWVWSAQGVINMHDPSLWGFVTFKKFEKSQNRILDFLSR